MKILLVGEYSGVHTYMKKELSARGYQVALAGDGDGFKGYPSDIVLTNAVHNIWEQKQRAYRMKRNLIIMKKYDIVQFINPGALYFYYTQSEILDLVNSAKLSVVLLCGCDGAFYKNYWKINPNLCIQCVEVDRYGNRCHKSDEKYLKYEAEFYKNIDIMIPLDWAYYEMHQEAVEREKMMDILPMPIIIGQEPEIKLNDKLKVLHPLNRKGFKGTPLIREAFIRLEKIYGKRAEFIIDGRLPYDKYMELVKSADIILDQTYSTSAGMTALLGMEAGKIVMGGNKRNGMIGQQEVWYRELPLLNLGDTVDEIVKNVSIVLEKTDEELLELKQQSRAYVKKHHDVQEVTDLLLEDYKKGILNKGAV